MSGIPSFDGLLLRGDPDWLPWHPTLLGLADGAPAPGGGPLEALRALARRGTCRELPADLVRRDDGGILCVWALAGFEGGGGGALHLVDLAPEPDADGAFCQEPREWPLPCGGTRSAPPAVAFVLQGALGLDGGGELRPGGVRPWRDVLPLSLAPGCSGCLLLAVGGGAP